MASQAHARAEFRAFQLVRRAEQPLPEGLPGAERMIGVILADVFTDWLAANAARFETPPKKGLLAPAPPGFQAVYETDASCVVTLRERGIVIPSAVTLATVDEMEAWRADRPGGMRGLYPIISSYFTMGLPTALFRRATARHRLRSGEAFLLHVRNAWTTPDSGAGGDDLWKTDGERLTLLASRFTRWKT